VIHIIAISGVILIAWLAVKFEKLTLPAGITGAALAMLIYLGAGNSGILLLGLFFISATIASSLGKKLKPGLGREVNTERRTAAQVLANGGVAGLAAILILLIPFHIDLLLLALAASLSSATADTLSSELGVIYGRRFYNILTLRKDTRGENGVVSAEGTLIGLAGSFMIAGAYAIAHGYGNNFWLIVSAGTVGNLADSVLGAALERRALITNDWVNFLNTLIAAAFSILIAALF
jgi:uncharacterized protein (TIGR00297 family)